MGKVIFDIRCNNCGYTEEDEWAEPCQESYGSCPACSVGVMKQVIGTPRFNMVDRVENMRGTTKNGTKWSVAHGITPYSSRDKAFKR